jgi:tripartite-type tricarboxylate transporter receptor subunit TctC
MTMNRLLLSLATLLGLASGPLPAQTFPARPITIYVGTSAGGTLDTIARVLSAQFEKDWGQPAIVESRVGGGGILATSVVTRAAPDGYSLTMGGSYNASLFVKEVPYDIKDIAPVSVVGLQYYFVLTSRAAGVKSLAELVAKAKANPGKVNFGIVPNGPHELETAELESNLGIRLTSVGYKGIAPIYLALIANEIDGTMGTTTPQMKTGEMIPLAVGGEKRHPDYPNVPTFRELGYAYDPLANYPLLGRAGTPNDVLQKIAAEVAQAVKSDIFVTRVTKIFSIEGVGSTPEWASKFMRDDYERLRKAAERAGVKPQ